MIIRPFRYDDLIKIQAILKTRDGMDADGLEKRTKEFEWIACRNPFVEDEPTYFIAEENGVIVGHLGRMPIKFLIEGKPYNAFFLHDLFVHPSFRKAGKGFFLSMQLYKAAEENSDTFCGCIWTTPLNLELQKRRGYKELWADRYVKILDPQIDLERVIGRRVFVKLAVFFMEPILKLLDSIIIRLLQSNITIKPIQRFDARFDALNDAISDQVRVSPSKTAEYLNWKYIDHPFAQFVVLAAEIAGDLKGFIVLSIKPTPVSNRMAIVDISGFLNDTRILSALFAAAVKYFRGTKSESIECCITDERIARIAKRFLFFKADTGDPVMLANLEKEKKSASITPISRWHLSLGDSDGFMWG